MNSSTAYLLIAHGSRDPRPQQAVDELAHAVRQRLSHQADLQSEGQSCFERPIAPLVGTAMLELALEPLHQQIVGFARRAAEAGHHEVGLLPLFLLPGVHVMEDLPHEVAIAQQQLGGAISLTLMPHVGASAGLSGLVQFSTDASTARVLLAHGTRRADGNTPIEAIATHHCATPAYWAVEPGLETLVCSLVGAGYRRVEIQPYFLFSGGITDAIAQQVEQLSQKFEQTQFHLLPPLGMTPMLVEVLMQVLNPPTPIAARP